MKKSKMTKVRYESFGGIVCWEEPPALMHVNKEFMKELGYKHSPLWNKKISHLSAPTEVHFSITNSCPMHCQHCYVNSGVKLNKELTTEEIKEAITLLASIGVFHIALGGGEPFSRKDCLEIAHFCREKGIVPNITTNGFYITDKIANECKVFGQINVSLDGLGDLYRKSRGYDGFAIADRALRLLAKYHPRVGINCVVSRQNFEHIPEIIKYASKLKLHSILILRFKPTGRAKILYEQRRLTLQQNKLLVPLLWALSRKTRVRLWMDCSFAPMVYYHRPDTRVLDFLSARGCVAGDILAGILPNGKVNACSFCPDTGGMVFEFKKEWHSNSHFWKFRNWSVSAPEPCRTCQYLRFCQGGCHIVAEYVLGDFNLPDPECPWVEEMFNQNKTKRRNYVKSEDNKDTT